MSGQIPTIGQQRLAKEAAVNQAVQSLSLQIYSHLATAYIGSRDEHQTTDCDHLRQLARDSHAAAQAFFEGLGVAKFGVPK